MSKVQILKIRPCRQEVRIEIGHEIVIIDRIDLKTFAEATWYIVESKGQSKYLRANVRVDGVKRTIGFHQLIMGIGTSLEVDHINNNGLDNRRANLRLVTHQKNMLNQPKRRGCFSRFVGVYKCNRSRRFYTQVRVDGKGKTIGRFDSEIEAAVAYNNYVLENKLDRRLNDV